MSVCKIRMPNKEGFSFVDAPFVRHFHCQSFALFSIFSITYMHTYICYMIVYIDILIEAKHVKIPIK